MDTTSAVNARFKIAVNKVIDDALAKNKSAIAADMNISKSKFSEILNDRMNVGINLLVKFCLKYNVNANWLLFDRGALYNTYETTNDLMKVAEPSPELEELQRLKVNMEQIQRRMHEIGKKFNL